MAYTIQSPFGRIDYYDNYGFDCIAQYTDKDGIMFGNYTKERIELTPESSNMVAVFRITKRKQITIAYWHGSQLKGLTYNHNEILPYSSEKRNSIIDTVLKAGYSVMLRPKESELIIWIDNGRFGQS